jgi:transglutaminase-like putative cysteine protease
MAYSVRHITSFRYEPAVRESVMEVRMQPRTDFRQRCLSFTLDVLPRATMLMYRDFYGNAVHHFDIPQKHALIEVTAQAIVDVLPAQDFQPEDAGDWSDLDARVAQTDYWEMLLPSQYAAPTELLEKLASELELQRRGKPLALLQELNARLYEMFDYVPNTTNVDSPIDDALEARRGVCQDFAHIMIALVRTLQIPCRYVSGYLHRRVEDHDRSAEDATHAWVEALLPHLGWVGFDPTNNLIAADRHLRTAIGRDYADVPPTKGIFRGKTGSELSVAVRVTASEIAPEVDQGLPVPEDWSVLVEKAQEQPKPPAPPPAQQMQQQQ